MRNLHKAGLTIIILKICENYSYIWGRMKITKTWEH